LEKAQNTRSDPNFRKKCENCERRQFPKLAKKKISENGNFRNSRKQKFRKKLSNAGHYLSFLGLSLLDNIIIGEIWSLFNSLSDMVSHGAVFSRNKF